MSKPGFSMGFKPKKLTISKPPASKPLPSRGAFGGSGNDSDDNDYNNAHQPAAFASPKPKSQMKSKLAKPPSPKAVVAITEFDFDSISAARHTLNQQELSTSKQEKKKKHVLATEPPSLKSRGGASSSAKMTNLGNMSSSLTSRKHIEDARSTDPTIFDYDSVYETLKQSKSSGLGDGNNEPSKGKKSRYMTSLLDASGVRARDRQIAEEKKITRERAAEGDLYADKEKFVTAAYKKLQEENARIAEEERLREEKAAKKNAGAGMSSFYKKLLQEDEERHAQSVKATEELALRRLGDRISEKGTGAVLSDGHKNDVDDGVKHMQNQEDDGETQKQLARGINSRGGNILFNDDGEVVDKRELLRSGLNVASKNKDRIDRHNREDNQHGAYSRVGAQFRGGQGAGGKAAMRERQSRMIEDQLSHQLKRSLEKEEAEHGRIERAAKTRKTEADVSSARERYLARKKAAEEAKRKGLE